MHIPGFGWCAAAGVAATLLFACSSGDDAASNQGSAAGAGAGASGSDAAQSGTAVAMVEPFGTGTVTGTATFAQNGTEVSLVVELNNCPDGAHGVHIHQGTSCADVEAQGGHWDMTRGEGIPDVTCSGNHGTSMVTRALTDPLAWTIGGPATTDLVGHVFVVHDATDPKTRVGCGPIAVH